MLHRVTGRRPSFFIIVEQQPPPLPLLPAASPPPFPVLDIFPSLCRRVLPYRWKILFPEELLLTSCRRTSRIVVSRVLWSVTFDSHVHIHSYTRMHKSHAPRARVLANVTAKTAKYAAMRRREKQGGPSSGAPVAI